ncbi:MAG TPA: HD-GYP domain-containing protein, partial [Clostridiales bacterium]|nr:HD-GYP domain-containing protein [Clostridiales bacterium]
MNNITCRMLTSHFLFPACDLYNYVSSSQITAIISSKILNAPIFAKLVEYCKELFYTILIVANCCFLMEGLLIMRFVYIDHLKEGIINARPIWGKNGELLLNAGTKIQESYIVKLKELGYHGIYVDDALSHDIEVPVLIDDNLRLECVKTIKNAFEEIESIKAIRSKTVDKLEKLIDDIIDIIQANKELLVNMFDLKVYDDYTFFHSVNVSVLSLAVGLSLYSNRNELFKLGLAALLHDVGKVFIPRKILIKNSSLTNEEFKIIKSHPLKGYQLVKDNNSFSHYFGIGILQHHERFDGSGYPFGLPGKKISLPSRIIAVADVYDALTSDRPYRKALFPSEAVEYIMGNGGILFEPHILKQFLKIITPYPVGTGVQLSNSKSGIVAKNYADCCMRPIVKIIKHGDIMVDPYLID